MGLNDRDYAREKADGSSTLSRNETQITAFVKDTYKLFAASMLAGSVGAFVGVPFAAQIHSMAIVLFIIEIGLLIGLYMTKNKPGINLMMLFGFTFMTGITIAPLLAYTLSLSGGSAIVGNAFAMTAFIFGSMSFFAIKTTHDFTSYTKPLFIALIVIVIGSLINAFVFQSPILMLAISAVVVLLFTVLVVYDTQNIMRGAYETPVEGAVALYLDFLNIFVALLQIFGVISGSDE